MAGQVYRSHADQIIDLLARQGDISAQGALRSGNIWSNEVANLGQQAGGVVQEIAAQQQEKKRQQALDFAVGSYDPKDPEGSFKRMAKVIGPVEAMKMQSGLEALHKKEEPTIETFDAKLDGVHAALQAYGPEGLAERWGTIAQSIDPEAKKFIPGWDASAPFTKETAASIEGLWQQRRGSKEKDTGFTLGAGQNRYDASGKLIASGPEKETPEKAVQHIDLGDRVEIRDAVTGELKQTIRKGLAPQPPTPAGAKAKPPTTAALNAAAFYSRAKDAIDNIESTDDKGKSLEERISKQGLLGQFAGQYGPNMIQSDDQQRYRQAQRAFTEARLRKESGAAIPQSEFDNDARTYFFQPGDGKKVLEQKKKAREAVLAGIKLGAGAAAPETGTDEAPPDA